MTNFSPFNVKDELKTLTVEEIREWQQTKTIPYSVAMYNTIKDFNLASVVRNVCAFGFQQIYIIGERKWDRRGAVGAYNYVQITHVTDFQQLIKHVDINNIVAMELPEHYPTINNFTPLYQYSFKPEDCLLLGQEGEGIPAEHLEQITNLVYVDQPGSMRSLNVATASGIAMYQMFYQHQKTVKTTF